MAGSLCIFVGEKYVHIIEKMKVHEYALKALLLHVQQRADTHTHMHTHTHTVGPLHYRRMFRVASDCSTCSRELVVTTGNFSRELVVTTGNFKPH